MSKSSKKEYWVNYYSLGLFDSYSSGWRPYYDSLPHNKYPKEVAKTVIKDHLPSVWLDKTQINHLVNDIWGCGPKTIENALRDLTEERVIRYKKENGKRYWKD